MKKTLTLLLAFTFFFGVYASASTILSNQNDNKDGVEDGNAGTPQRPHDKRRHGHAE